VGVFGAINSQNINYESRDKARELFAFYFLCDENDDLCLKTLIARNNS
jgi:hypothetical protein